MVKRAIILMLWFPLALLSWVAMPALFMIFWLVGDYTASHAVRLVWLQWLWVIAPPGSAVSERRWNAFYAAEGR